jgi:hypothetical protein
MNDPNPKPEPTVGAPRANDPESTALEETGPRDVAPEAPRAELPLDEVELRDLLRSVLASPSGAPAPRLLRGIQGKLRRRSRGKFYGDGWSVAKSPRATYFVTSVLMLALMALIYFVLVPWGGSAIR